MKQRGGIESLHVEKMAPSDIHWCLLNVCGEQAVNVSAVKVGLCVQHFPNNTIITAVRLWVTPADAVWHAALVHCR